MCIWVQNLVGPLPFLAGACRWLWWGGPLPILAEGPVGAVLNQSWLGPAAGFGWVGDASNILVEGSVVDIPRHSWLVPATGFGRVAGPSPVLAGALWA